MQPTPVSAQRNGAVLVKYGLPLFRFARPSVYTSLTPISANTNAVLDSQYMVPGKTYIGILPGHTKPAFVRKPALDVARRPGMLAQVFGPSRQAYSVIDPLKFNMFGRKYRDRYYYDRATDTYRPLAATQYATPTCTNGTGRVVTSVQQTCASCGKFRSASWQARHPLAPGVTPIASVCRKCHGKYTSSEEVYPSHNRRRRHHYPSRSPSRRYSRRYADSTEDYYSSRDYDRPSRRDRAYSRDFVRPRSHSGGNVRVVIANQSGDRTVPRREYTRSSSTDGVRVIRRTEIIDEPKHSRSRSRLRSSRASYIEDGARYIDDLTRPRYYSKPRSLSRSRYLNDEIDGPEYHSSLRNTGRVAFVDDLDEPVIVSRPRSRLSRRRAMIFDGAADTGSSEQEAYDRTLFADREAHGRTQSRRGAEVVQDSIKSSSDVSSSTTVRADGSAQTIAETITPASGVAFEPFIGGIHKSSLSRPEDSFTSESSFSSGHSTERSLQPSVEDYESDGHVVPLSTSSTGRKSVSFNDTPSFSNNDEASDEPMNMEPLKSPTPSVDSRESSQQQELNEPETPLYERRRRYRGSNHSSVSDIALPAPPLSPLAGKLSEMLQSMQITPPRGSSDCQISPQDETTTANRKVGSEEFPSSHIQGTPPVRPSKGVWADQNASRHQSRSQSSEDEDSPLPTPLSTPPLNSPGWDHSPRRAAERAYFSEGNAYDGTYHQSAYGYMPAGVNYHEAEIYEHPDRLYTPGEEKVYPGSEAEIYEHPDAPCDPMEVYDYPSYEPWMELTEAEKEYDWAS